MEASQRFLSSISPPPRSVCLKQLLQTDAESSTGSANCVSLNVLFTKETAQQLINTERSVSHYLSLAFPLPPSAKSPKIKHDDSFTTEEVKAGWTASEI